MKVLEIIEAIARERCIEQNLVKEIMQSILLDFAVSKYGDCEALKAEIFDDGSFEIFLEQEVVEKKDEKDFGKIELEDARNRNSSLQLGEFVKEVLPLSIGKADVEKIFFELRKKLNEVQKEREYEFFKDKIGTNITGYIKRVDVSEALISFPEGEGVLRKNDMLPNDVLRAGNYIKVYIKDVRQSLGRQIFLSRTHEGFLKELLKQEVPEIQDGLVEIKAIARDSGSLAKVAVYSNRGSINPVSVCIGAYGSRIQAVTKELLGEKISIIEWNENIIEFIANALSPAQILKVAQVAPIKYEAITEQDQFSKAMGRGGQNVVLAKRLCSVGSIRLLTQEEEAKLYQENVNKKVEDLTQKLEIEEMMAHLLISQRLETVHKIATASKEDVAKLNGFDEELAVVLQDRAVGYLQEENAYLKEELAKIDKDGSLFELSDLLTNEHIKILIQNGIYQKNELAMLDAQELLDVFEEEIELNLSFEQACAVIAKARGIKQD